MRAQSHDGIDLARLVGMADLSEFFDATWERAPRLAPAALSDALDNILTLEQFEVLVAGVPGGLSIVDRQIARPVAAIDSDTGRRPSVYEAYRRGCSILLAGLQLRLSSVARICRAVENEVLSRGIPLAEAVAANGYLTPVRARGFDLHYDNHCAFIVQLHGAKDWTVFAPNEELPVARCERAIDRGELGEPLMQRALEPGDVLYIPRGYPHVASTANTSSLHVTFSLRTMTWSELLVKMCDNIPTFRRSVAPWSRVAPAPQEYFESELMPRLGQLHVASFVRRRLAECLARLSPVPGKLLREIDESHQIASDTAVARVPQVMCVATQENGSAELRFPDGALRLPAAMMPVFDFIASHDEFVVHELPAIGAQYDAIELTQILVRRGLLYRKCLQGDRPSTINLDMLVSQE